MKTVIGLYDDISQARATVQDLVDAGINREDISLLASDREGEYARHFEEQERHEGDHTGDTGSAALEGAVAGGVIGGLGGVLLGLGIFAIPGLGPVVAAGPIVAGLVGAGVGAATGGLIGGLVGWGVPEEEAGYYAEGVRRGGTLVAVKAPDERANEVVGIMNRHDPIDVERKADEWRAEGWTGYDETAGPYTGRARQDQTAIPVVEEELHVGKREVDRDRVRIHTYVETEPVEEQVRLREERVRVDRRPTDRPASQADLETFEEGTFEVSETAEELVKDKQARVVEEVVIDKDVDERTETVRDDVRRTRVDVENVGTESHAGSRDYNTYLDTFRGDYESRYGTAGFSFDRYEPAYRYGYDLATHNRYQGRSWQDIEPEARRRWDEYNQNTWDEFKDAVRHAWDEVKDAFNGDTEEEYGRHELAFRRHYQTHYAGAGYEYDRYDPAYRYGYDLATDERYRDRDWTEIEPNARRRWNEHNQGTWEEFKDSVRHGWEEVKRAFD